MRIMMISDHADPLAEAGSKEAGGQNVYVYFLSKFLAKEGIYVDIYTRWDRRNKKNVIKLDSHRRVIRVKAGPKRYVPRDSFYDYLGEFEKHVIKRIQREKLKYDLIHTNYLFSGVMGLRLAKRLRVPMVHVYHSIGAIRYRELKKFKEQKSDSRFFQKRMKHEAEIAHGADGIIATSPVEKTLIARLFRVSAKKIKVIPIGVDIDVFRPIEHKKAQRRLRLPLKKKIILYVGRLEWRKGIGTLLFAFNKILKKYPRSLLLIRSGGSSKSAVSLESAEDERIRKIIRELGLKKKVKILGPKKQKDLSYYYSAADVVAVPSYYEPFGIVPLEAFACGTPVVASRTGGLRYTTVAGITGYLAKPRDYDDLARKIAKVLKVGRRRYSENCISHIRKNFLWENIIESYAKYFNEITK